MIYIDIIANENNFQITRQLNKNIRTAASAAGLMFEITIPVSNYINIPVQVVRIYIK